MGRTPWSARVPPDPLFGGLINFSSRPTRAPAADRGSAHLVFNGVTMGLRPTKGDEDALWRTHFCVPRSHSCERLEFVKKGVRKSANTARRSACATMGSVVFNGALPRNLSESRRIAPRTSRRFAQHVKIVSDGQCYIRSADPCINRR